MRLDKKTLNLVIPLESGDKTVYIHSAPVSRDIFETFHAELGKTFATIFDGTNPAQVALSAPQLAYPALKLASKAAGTWEKVEFGFINELTRLTNVIYPTAKGYKTLPFELAAKQGILNEDDESEVISSLVFFTCVWFVSPRGLKQTLIDLSSSIRNWESSSLTCSEFQRGLKTSTETETTEPKATASPIIS